MPELPEVDVTAQALRETIVGQVIDDAAIIHDHVLQSTLSMFQQCALKKSITAITRHGKLLSFHLSDGFQLLFHFRMTGMLILEDAHISTHQDKHVLDKHVHAIFSLAPSQKRLLYRDPRRFGRITPHHKEHSLPMRLGPDALLLTMDHLYKHTQERKTPIKSIILDQSIVAGIGNIYADEILFLSKIHPKTPGHELKSWNIECLHKNIETVLKEAISMGGSSIRSFHNPNMRKGRYQEKHKVYGKEGHPCIICMSHIERIKISGRSTHFCPQCQQL